MLYTDDSVFAAYLASTFELLWRQSVPAEERIQELLEQGPHRPKDSDMPCDCASNYPLFKTPSDSAVLDAYLYTRSHTHMFMPSGMVIDSIGDAVAVISKILESAQREIVFVTSPSLLSIAGTFDTVESATRLIERGGTLRGITTISRANLEEARLRVDVGLDLRHSDQPHELSLFVGDKRYSMSGINTGVEEYSLDTQVKGFWSEDPVYAEFLLALFESAWSQAVPAAQRIEELLQRGEQR